MNSAVIPCIDPLTTIIEKEQRARERAKKVLEGLRNQKIRLIKVKRFTCSICKQESAFGELGFVQDHRYEHPHGCMGGDTWHRSEKNVCHLVCPHCNTMNYIYNHTQREAILRYIELCGLDVTEIFASVFDNHPTERGQLRLTQIYPKP